MKGSTATCKKCGKTTMLYGKATRGPYKGKVLCLGCLLEESG